MNEAINATDHYPMPLPNPALQKLNRFVGTWSIRGYDNLGSEITGHEKYEWMEGGFFLKHELAQNYAGLKIKALQIIGLFRAWGDDAPGKDFTSHFFDNMGNTWEYVWELSHDTVTIWTGYIGSPAVYTGVFSKDGNSLTGEWKWPGGGYSATLTRVIER